jgi:chorismate mutase-like protein
MAKEHAEPRHALKGLRREIDELNSEILRLVQRRAEVVVEIGRHKEALGIEAHDPGREADMLRRLTAVPGGPFAPAELRRIFRAVFRASLELQRRLRRERRPSLAALLADLLSRRRAATRPESAVDG